MTPRLKRLFLGVTVGLAVLAGGLWILIRTLGAREYLYAGKTIYYWQERMNSPVSEVSNETRLVIETRIVPRLRDVMLHDDHDSKLRIALVEQLNTLPGVQIYYSPADGRRAQAAAALGSLGPHAQAALPDLLSVIDGKDEAVRVPAVNALGQIRTRPETVIPRLIACLDDPQDGMAVAAVESLGKFGPLSRPAWPKLIPLLKIRDKDMRKAMSDALPQIDPEEAAKVLPK
jgi:HEAT repeat protein